MPRQQDIPLKIELLSGSDNERFLVRSPREIHFILQAISRRGTRVALYYDEGNSFILTTLLGINENGLWLEHGSNSKDNLRLLQSRRIIFISSYLQVKIQFVSPGAKSGKFGEIEAICLPLPDTLLRIQRREYYRLATPVLEPLRCQIPVGPDDPAPREMVIMDISCGGVALTCGEQEAELQPGKTYRGCRIQLDEDTIIDASIEVRNAFQVTLPTGTVLKRAGCSFVDLDGQTTIQLQRYITQQQQDRIKAGT